MNEMIRRRMMMGGSAKPYDAEVEYIRMTSVYGTYTQFSPIQGYVDIKFSIRNTTADGNLNEFLIIGGWNSGYARKCRYDIIRWGTSLNVVEENVSASATIGRANGTVITRSKINYDSSQAPLADYGHFILRGFSTDEFSIYYMKFRDLYSNTIHDYIPVRVGNVGRLYDRVQGVILPSTNMTIVPGPDKTA